VNAKRFLAYVPVGRVVPFDEFGEIAIDKEFIQNLSASHRKMFHNIRPAHFGCSSKAKMSALSKVEMSVSAPFWEFGGCHFDGHGGDEQARAEPS
jgi:hypothetical protein